VDDELEVLRFLDMGLDMLGYSVVTASSGEEALALFAKTHFDAVICDLGMPGIGGWEVARRLKEARLAKGEPRAPFIVLTGLCDQRVTPEELRRAGVDKIEFKPSDLSRLEKTIRSFLP
jgi:CheY-like chemotaxis protein